MQESLYKNHFPKKRGLLEGTILEPQLEANYGLNYIYVK